MYLQYSLLGILFISALIILLTTFRTQIPINTRNSYLAALVVLSISAMGVLYPLSSEINSVYYIVGLLMVTFSVVYITYQQHLSEQPLTTVHLLSYISFISVLVYFSGTYIPFIRKLLIETVTFHTVYLLELLSYPVSISTGPDYGYLSEYSYTTNGHTYITYINIACTGIGSISVISGIISVMNTTTTKKVIFWSISFVVIYIANLIRNVFISIAFFSQSFSFIPNWLLGVESSEITSFVVAEVYISQLVSVFIIIVALIYVEKNTNYFKFIDELRTELKL